MSVYEMSEQLQVSRTPVREAFIRLAERIAGGNHAAAQNAPVSRIDVSRAQQRFMREALEIGVIPSLSAHADRRNAGGYEGAFTPLCGCHRPRRRG